MGNKFETFLTIRDWARAKKSYQSNESEKNTSNSKKRRKKIVKLLSRKCHKSKKENSKKISVKKNDKWINRKIRKKGEKL